MSKNTFEIIPLSDAISSPIIKAYKVGGLGLTFIFVGTFLLLAALFFHQGSWISYLSAILGTLMILAVLYLFYIKDIRRLDELNQKIENNKELIDTVQKAAIEMTDLSYELQALAFKYSNEVANELSQIRPIVREIKNLPLISHLPGIEKLSQIADNEYVIKAENFSSSIVNTTLNAKGIVEDIKIALINSDPKLLKKYLKQVQDLNKRVKDLLKTD